MAVGQGEIFVNSWWVESHLGSNCNECCFAYVKTYETLSNFIKEKNTHLEKERKEHQEKTNIQSTNNIQKCKLKNKVA